MTEAELRTEVIAAALAMNSRGLNLNKSGNVSARIPGSGSLSFLITPSGVPYESLSPSDVSLVAKDERGGWRFDGPLPPSSEWLMHAMLYGEPGVGAIVHTHSRHAAALSCMEKPIPPFHIMVAAAGGSDISCAPYRPFGSPELAAAAARAMRGRKACLLAHHGSIAAGGDLTAALNLAAEVENLAAMYLAVLPVGGVRLLPEEEVERAAARLSGREAGRAPKDRKGLPAWTAAGGEPIACAEKLKVLDENYREIEAAMRDALDDAVLMGCRASDVRRELAMLAAGLESSYPDMKNEDGNG